MNNIMKTMPLAFVALAATFFSCSNDDNENIADDNEIRIEAVHPSSVTRVNDTGFDKNDQIGVFVTTEGEKLQPGGNVVNNGVFSYNGSAWSSARKYYWNEGKHNVYAYYPYQAKVEDTEDFIFNLPIDQSTDAGYSQADFLWAKAEGVMANSNPVRMQFCHILSKVVVELVKSDDYEGALPTDMQVYVHGTAAAATIDLSTGGATADGQASTTSIKAKKLTNTQFTAIVAPQRISSRRPLVEVVSGNVSYLLEGTISLKQGVQHTITVTLSKSPEQVEIEIGGGIGGWQ